ncbi:unnamed protein product [Cochlearia groenlandica]
MDVEVVASQVTQDSETTPSPELINKTYLERVKPNRGRIYDLGSKQFEVFEPSEPKAMLESQKVLLATLGIDPETNLPFSTRSPYETASNTTPQRSPGVTPSVNRE